MTKILAFTCPPPFVTWLHRFYDIVTFIALLHYGNGLYWSILWRLIVSNVEDEWLAAFNVTCSIHAVFRELFYVGYITWVTKNLSGIKLNRVLCFHIEQVSIAKVICTALCIFYRVNGRPNWDNFTYTYPIYIWSNKFILVQRWISIS